MTPIAALITLLAAAAAPAQSADPFAAVGAAGQGAHVTVRAVPSHNRVTPGQTFHVAVDIRIDDGWVFYAPNPGPYAIGASITTDAPGLAVRTTLWPGHKQKPTSLGEQTVVNNVYERRVVVYVPLEVPADAKPGWVTVIVTVAGQICETSCIDVKGLTASIPIMVGPLTAANPAWLQDPAFAAGLPLAKPVTRPADTPATAAAPQAMPDIPKMEFIVFGKGGDVGLWAGLGLAVLAGLILNIMPCVLPVIPLKVLSIVEQAGQSRRRFVTMGLAFAAGIVLFFLGLVALNLVLKLATGSALNWGQHFQYTWLRVSMAVLIVLVAANMFGLFNVTVSGKVAAAEDSVRGRGGHLSSLGMGFFVGILSTPCSFGILTAAIVWAQGKSLAVGSLALLLIGVGMAVPYVILAALPKLVDRLPKPGRWMELFKQSMGFIMLLVAVWLIATGSRDGYAFWVVAYMVVFSFCVWMWGSWVRYDATLRRKLIVRGIALLLAVGAGVWMLRPPATGGVNMEKFDWAQISRLRAEGNVVVVDLTAAWCLTCKTVELNIYRDADVAAHLSASNVRAFHGDVTTADLPANALKNALNNEPVPSTVVLGKPGRPAILLRGLFSKSDLFKAIEKARSGP